MIGSTPPMDAAEEFSRHRPLLLGLAYRMLGSRFEAEDAVQDAFLRWSQADRREIDSPRAWLSSVVTRICLDQMKSARARREHYVGPWLPEPVRTEAVVTPDETAEDLESISTAFLVLLESLSPLERAAWVLHEIFDHSYEEISEILGREPAACRQLVHRAREHVKARKPRFAPTREDHARLLGVFLDAVVRGDVATLETVLSRDAVSISDGGGKAIAAGRPLEGIPAIARFWIGIATKGAAGGGVSIEIADVNGWPAALLRVHGVLRSVVTIETDGRQIAAIRAIVNPDKLRALS